MSSDGIPADGIPARGDPADGIPAEGVAARGVRWPSRAGAWLGIGTSPAALALGAGLAERHGGAIGVIGITLGVVLMAAMLHAQGLIGLAPPNGEGTTLSGAADRYLGRWTLAALHLLLALAMVGWFGFNVGLGGAALATVTGAPPAAGPLLLGVPIVVIAASGLRRWNALAVGTTLCALALVGLIVARFAPPVWPIAAGTGGWLADAGAFVGYVAVFGLRAPDFSYNLAARRDLRWCVGLLVGATGLVAVAGAALFLGTGTADVVGAITSGPGGGLGNVLVTVAVVAATFTTLHSGSLALRAITRIRPVTAMAVIATPGLALAIVRFDRLLLSWLAVLGALLPPLLVPMAVEAARRRRGHPPRAVRMWTWAPAALIALALTLRGVGVAALVGIAVSAASTALATRIHR